MAPITFLHKSNTLIIHSSDPRSLERSLSQVHAKKPSLLTATKNFLADNDDFNEECLNLVLSFLEGANLDTICLNYARLSAHAISSLPRSLLKLGLTGVDMPIQGFSSIGQFLNLTELWCDSVNSIQDGAFCHVPPLNDLVSIILDGSLLDRNAKNGGSSTIEYLGHLPKLKNLSLELTDLRPDDLDQIANCCNLESLNLARNPTVAPSLKKLGGLQELKKLNLSYCRIKTTHLRDIHQLEKVEELSLLGNPKLSALCLDHIAHLPSLKKLSLSRATLDDKGALLLFANNSLSEVMLRNCFLPANFGKIVSASCVKKLELKGSNLDAQGLRGLINCATLRYLDIRGTFAARERRALIEFKAQRGKKGDCVLRA